MNERTVALLRGPVCKALFRVLACGSSCCSHSFSFLRPHSASLGMKIRHEDPGVQPAGQCRVPARPLAYMRRQKNPPGPTGQKLPDASAPRVGLAPAQCDQPREPRTPHYMSRTATSIMPPSTQTRGTSEWGTGSGLEYSESSPRTKWKRHPHVWSSIIQEKG